MTAQLESVEFVRRVVAQADAARVACPEIEIPDDAWTEYVMAKIRLEVDAGADAEQVLALLRFDDLYLSCGCALRYPAAIARFEKLYFPEVDSVARRFPRLPITLDDVRQQLRERLFLRENPSIAGFAGKGGLRGWVRAAALHHMLNIASRETRETPNDERFFEAIVDNAAGSDAVYLRMACRAEFDEALEAAMTRISAREKGLLRYAFADGLTVDQIAVLYGVHRATAARWVAGARERLVAETRHDLVTRLRISEHDAESIVRAALSGIGSTFLQRFRTP